jgi:hypothetical protein
MQPGQPVTTVAALSFRERAQAVFAIAALKIAVLVFDPNPRFFLWDSVTYLQGAVGNGLPRDRSFLYSLVIRLFAVPAHSLHALVIVQTIAGAVSAYLVYFIARRFLDVPRNWALLVALVLAAAPEQLFYERMIMAEAIGGLLWLGYLTLALTYLADGRLRWLAALALCGILTIAFRLNGTIVILLSSLTLPLLRTCWMPTANTIRPRWRAVVVPLALAIGCTAIAHLGYRGIVGVVAHTRPGYIGTEGLFLLGFAAPAVREEDFHDTGCAPDVLSQVRLPLADPRMRERQLWGDDGLWAAIRRACPNPERVADRVAHRALARSAGLLLPMAVTTLADYFDTDAARWRLDSDLGRKGVLPLELIDIARRYFFLDVKPIAFTDSLTSLWFQQSRWWLTGAFLLAPALGSVLYLVARRTHRAAEKKMLALLLIGLFLSQFLFAPVIVFRYLHPFPPLILLGATALFAPRLVPAFRTVRTGGTPRMPDAPEPHRASASRAVV